MTHTSLNPILVVDFDGVLNHNRWFASKAALSELDRERVGFDPEAIARLNRIVERSGAGVVISSKWRATRSILQLQALLERNGFTGEVIGKTPSQLGLGDRGEEIAAWVRLARFQGPYAVLDDIDQVGAVQSHFVKVDPAVGLQDEQVEAALRLLKGEA